MMLMRKKTSLIQITALVVVFIASFFAGKFIAGWGSGASTIASQGRSVSDVEKAVSVDRLNVLLLGIDARPGEKDARSDSMILVSIDKNSKKIAMVSIPRDSLVDISGYGKNKINSANALGGAELARTTVEDLLDIQIPYYVKTNFDGFKEIVDTLGGVDMQVEKRMYYPAEGINLRPGQQRLNGLNALAYVRFRHDALGDITRTERQQKFLASLAKEMMQTSTIIKLPRLIPQLMKAVDTNLGAGDAIFLAGVASKLDSNNIITATLPGVFYNYKGASYWKVDESKTKLVINDLFKGLKVATISGPDITVPVNKPAERQPKPKQEDTTETSVNLNESPVSSKETGNNSLQDAASGQIESAKPDLNQGSVEQPKQEVNNSVLPPETGAGVSEQTPLDTKHPDSEQNSKPAPPDAVDNSNQDTNQGEPTAQTGTNGAT